MQSCPMSKCGPVHQAQIKVHGPVCVIWCFFSPLRRSSRLTQNGQQRRGAEGQRCCRRRRHQRRLDAGDELKEPRVEGILWPQEEGNPSLRPSNIAAVEISGQEPKPQHPAWEGTKVPIFVTLASNS
jgi:hypothetical protein